MKIKELELKLTEIGVAEPRAEAFLLLNHLFGVSHADILLDREREYDSSLLLLLLDRRKQNEPIQYIIGSWGFMGSTFKVSPACLIPRPDTEILVYEALRLLKTGGSVADLCTGSGCIGICVAKERTDIKSVVLADISSDALQIAQENAILNGVEEKCTLVLADVTKEIPNGKYDMILSNPPYILSEDIDSLAPEVKKEPLLALDGGADGLDIINALVDKCPASLNEDGYLLIEFGFDQGHKIRELMDKKVAQGVYKSYKIIKDYGDNDRVLVAQV